MMTFKWTEDIHHPIYFDALAIRKHVFVQEQNVPEALEIDDLENRCYHVVLYKHDQAIATARLYVTENYGKVQRVAVMREYRGNHVGEQLMSCVEQYAKTLSIHTLKLGAQQQAIPFYQKLGYTICSEDYLDAGIWHNDMIKKI